MTLATSRARPGTTGRSTGGFRGDVQGLRAIAVLTVIAYHAGVPFLPGGFVGVDVFFVISGYLISGLLYREADRDGRISIRDFYARRARRILPAATIVLLATVAASVVWVSVVDSLSAVTDAMWATFFAANLRFIAVGTDYDATDFAPSPLQHYWSLSVEEQFYLVWPLLLLGCLVLAARSRGGRRAATGLPRPTVFWVLVVVTVVSFAYGVWDTAAHPDAAYFSTFARAWELAVGALTALVARPVAERLSSSARALLCGAGLLAIAVACTTLHENGFPGVPAALPVAGSALVLLAGAGGHDREPLPVRALAVAPMRLVGDWSYSLYLWHWPLLTIPLVRGYTAGEEISATTAVLAVAATFVLSGLTYRYVETPFRDARRLPRPRALAMYPVSVVVVAAACAAASVWGHYRAGEFGDAPAITVANSGIRSTGAQVSKDPTVALVQASVVAAREHHDVPSDLRPDKLSLRDDVPDVGACDYEQPDVRELCPRGDPDADRTLVVLGNSHGRMWIPAFERIAEHSGWRTYYFVKPNCTAARLLVNDLAEGRQPWDDCSEWRDWALDQITELHPDLAVAASSGPNPVVFLDDGTEVDQKSPDRETVVRDGWVDTLGRLEQAADRTVLIRDVPKNEHDPSTCLTSTGIDLGDCAFTPLAAQEADSEASVAGAEQVGAEVVDPTRWLCWDDLCPAVIGRTISYRDRGHITSAYSEELGDDLGREMGIWR